MNIESDITALSDGDTVILHPKPENPLIKKPERAIYQSGYFYLEQAATPDGSPDFYFGDVLLYNVGWERMAS